MELIQAIRDYVQTQSKISNLQTQERILHAFIKENLKEPTIVGVNGMNVRAEIEKGFTFLIPEEELPHINADCCTASFHDGRKIFLKETPVEKLKILFI